MPGFFCYCFCFLFLASCPLLLQLSHFLRHSSSSVLHLTYWNVPHLGRRKFWHSWELLMEIWEETSLTCYNAFNMFPYIARSLMCYPRFRGTDGPRRRNTPQMGISLETITPSKVLWAILSNWGSTHSPPDRSRFLPAHCLWELCCLAFRSKQESSQEAQP